jgi:hypothetical protein
MVSDLFVLEGSILKDENVSGLIVEKGIKQLLAKQIKFY